MSQELLAFDHDGGPRSGKSTIVGGLRERYPESVAVIEAGKTYRAVSRLLLDSGRIELGMPPDVITQEVTELGSSLLTDMTTRTDEVIAELGDDALHTDEIDKVVGSVSQVPT